MNCAGVNQASERMSKAGINEGHKGMSKLVKKKSG